MHRSKKGYKDKPGAILYSLLKLTSQNSLPPAGEQSRAGVCANTAVLAAIVPVFALLVGHALVHTHVCKQQQQQQSGVVGVIISVFALLVGQAIVKAHVCKQQQSHLYL